MQPTAPPYAIYLSIASLIVAALALLRALVTDRRARRIERDSRFEAAYGSHLRDELRTFQKRVSEFRIYTFPSGKSVDELKIEIDEFRIELEEDAFSLRTLLRELDQAKAVRQKGWERAFSNQTENAELRLQSMSHPSVATELEFAAKAEGARDAYQLAIDAIRAMLADEVSKP